MEHNTQKFYLPAEAKERFNCYIENLFQHVEGVTYTVGACYDKLFRTDTKRVWHTVFEVTVTLPDTNNWKLIASVEGDLLFVVDKSKQVVFSNPKHGTDYRKCDCCGHWCKNSYIIRHKQTGKELQVGGECLKKYGIEVFQKMADLSVKIVNTYGGFSDNCPLELYPVWAGAPDHFSTSAVLKTDLIRAAKAYYNESKVWVKSSVNTRMGSAYAIQENLNNEVFDGDEAYAQAVCDHLSQRTSTSAFDCSMFQLAANYYAQPKEAAAAYFMVKEYEDYLRTQQLDSVTKGMQVKVTGKVISTKRETTRFGVSELHTIETPKGYLVERMGTIPVSDDQTTSFYAIVKYLYHGSIVVERALKNPKKGIPVFEL